MDILLTTPTYPPFNSGLGNAVSRQAGWLTAVGYRVVVATGGKVRQQRKEENGVIVEEFPLTGSRSLLRPVRGDVSAYVDFLIHSDFDVVLMNAWQNWATDLVFQHIRAVRGRKYLYSHCISTEVFFPHQPLWSTLRYLAWRPYRWGLARRLRALDGVIFLADSGSDSRFDDVRVARACGVASYVVPNSLSAPAMNVLSARPRALEDRSQLIAVGSYQWQKGFDFVLKAYALSSAKNRIPLKFFGQERTPYTESLRAMASRFSIKDDYICFREGISGDGLLEEYCKSSVFLSGSHTECQPLVLLDANAAGTPFVARDTGCIAKMPGGVCVENAADMASKIHELTNDPIEWAKYSAAGRQAAARVYHPEITGRLLIEILEERVPIESSRRCGEAKI